MCAAPNALIYESDCAALNPFRDQLCGDTALKVIDGCIEPYDLPGLGLEIDESLFARYPGIPGPCNI